MRLTIDGQQRDFVDIRNFRAEHTLPPEFGVALFEPKDYTGLASIEGAGAELNDVREAVLAHIPHTLRLSKFPELVARLASLFRAQLEAINPRVKLKPEEIDFAVAGFEDVCRALMYALIQAQATYTSPPDFHAVYAAWLDGTTRLSQTAHTYQHHNTAWTVYIVNHAYGRVGLIVDDGQAAHYVRDASLACPAEGFMFGLLGEVAARFSAALVG